MFPLKLQTTFSNMVCNGILEDSHQGRRVLTRRGVLVSAYSSFPIRNAKLSYCVLQKEKMVTYTILVAAFAPWKNW